MPEMKKTERHVSDNELGLSGQEIALPGKREMKSARLSRGCENSVERCASNSKIASIWTRKQIKASNPVSVSGTTQKVARTLAKTE